MRVIDADKGLISKIQRETGCNFITAQKIVDSMPTEWIPPVVNDDNSPFDNIIYKELRSMALRVKHKTGSIDTLIDRLDDLLRGAENE